MSHSPVIGLIGLGTIGSLLGQRLLASDLELVVHDIDPQRHALFGDGVRVATSPAEVGDAADVVLSCLGMAEAHRAAVLGERGLQWGSRCRTYVHTGTSGKTLLLELAEPLMARGITVLDAPVSGGPSNAARGTLTTLASGNRAVFERAQATLRTYSSAVVYLGEQPGEAQTLKLVNNFLLAANLATACEALAMGWRCGFSSELLLDVVNHGSGANSATQRHLPEYVVPGRFEEGGTIGLMIKDLRLALDEARDLQVPVSLSQEVLDVFTAAGEQLGMDAHFASVIHYFARGVSP